ncbi:MAG: competence/damage-inducible protein A [Phycisphaerae bacterium]
MQAILLAVGDELTSGQTVDTNSGYLAMQLAQLGIATVEHRTVRDNLATLTGAITEAAARAELVLVTGGLGPTADDLTRQALADAMGDRLVLHEPSLREIEAFFRRRGREMKVANNVQAMLPASAEPLVNPIGTAPGIAAELAGAKVFCMPGVPREMQKMFAEQIQPRLPAGTGRIVFAQMHIAGMGESDVGTAIADLMHREGDLLVGTTASGGMVSIRVTARGQDERAARAAARKVLDEISGRLGPAVVGEDDCKLPQAVANLLIEKGQTLATAESCSGGLIAKVLTDTAGASDYFRGSIVAYHNEIKQKLLGVDTETLEQNGAVSEPVALQMADGAREALGVDWAISVTGIAGPAGGSEQKPVGTVWIGLAGPDGTSAWRHQLPGDRGHVRLRTLMAALSRLRNALLGIEA